MHPWRIRQCEMLGAAGSEGACARSFQGLLAGLVGERQEANIRPSPAGVLDRRAAGRTAGTPPKLVPEPPKLGRSDGSE